MSNGVTPHLGGHAEGHAGQLAVQLGDDLLCCDEAPPAAVVGGGLWLCVWRHMAAGDGGSRHAHISSRPGSNTGFWAALQQRDAACSSRVQP